MSDTSNSEFILAVAAAVVGVAALIFAILQTVTALSTYLDKSNRCSQSVTGPFKLSEGALFSIVTFTWNPRYRMPVITMPLLRNSAPVMEADPVQADFVSGTNFNQLQNSYQDGNINRVTSGPPLKTRNSVNLPGTASSIAWRIMWAPFGLAWFLIFSVVCIPCEVVCFLEHLDPQEEERRRGLGGCGGSGIWSFRAISEPLTCVWTDAIKYGDSPSLEALNTPHLECAQWCQLLVNTQEIWWGHGNMRWEWRLASAIPGDLHGAPIESAMADIQLIASMSGMFFPKQDSVVAQSRCGERIALSQHSTLGRIAHYQSNRDNSAARITMKCPPKSSAWMRHCINTHRLYRTMRFDLSLGPDAANKRIATFLGRPRTIYDAQLNFPLMDATLKTIVPYLDSLGGRIYKDMHDLADWSMEKVIVRTGPLGSGPGHCSCLLCCQEWVQSLGRRECYTTDPGVLWPALYIDSTEFPDVKLVGPPYNERFRLSSGDAPKRLCPAGVTPMLEVNLEKASLCHGSCPDEACICGVVARVKSGCEDGQGQHLAFWAAAAINTAWLSRATGEKLRQAAELTNKFILSGQTLVSSCEGSGSGTQENAGTAENHSPEIDNLATVIAYTENILPIVRAQIGSVNIEDDTLVPDLTDFTPVVLGS